MWRRLVTSANSPNEAVTLSKGPKAPALMETCLFALALLSG